MSSNLHLHVLASGSRGNAAIIEGPKESILIDCGICRKRILQYSNELGVDVSKITSVLLTHEHSDHTKGLPVFSKHFQGNMYTTQGSAHAKKLTDSLDFIEISHSQELVISGIKVTCFPCSHDVCDPIGFRFSTDTDAIGYCTDTGYLTDEAKEALVDTRILALESNHDETMLRCGDYPRFLKERIASREGHLSNAQTAAYLPELITDRCEQIVAMHLSQDNNRPSTCVRCLAEALGAKDANAIGTKAITSDGKLHITAAAQEAPASFL